MVDRSALALGEQFMSLKITLLRSSYFGKIDFQSNKHGIS